MRRTAVVLTALVPFFFNGCSTPDVERQDALAGAEAHCDGEGKQFILGNIEKKGANHWGTYDTIVSGHCVGPGDAGYVPSPKTSAD